MSVWGRNGKWRWKLVINKECVANGTAATKGEAFVQREQARKEVREQGERASVTWFRDVANQYLAHAERRFVKQTFEYKLLVYRRFRNEMGNVPIDQIDLRMVERFLARRPSNHNYNVHLKELNALFNWAWRRGLMNANPCTLAERMPEHKIPKAVPTPAEMHRIMLAAGPDRPLLMVLYYTLARIDEILRLKWDDVDFEGRTVRLWTRKRKHGNMEPDLVPMSDELHKVLRGLWASWKPHSEGWVFLNPVTDTRFTNRPKLMKTICKRAGVPHYGFHAIRHFVASYMRHKMNRSLGEVKELCRHQSERTTEIYTQNVNANQFENVNQLPNPEVGFAEPVACAPLGAPPSTLALLSHH